MKNFIQSGKWLALAFTVSAIFASDVAKLLESADEVLQAVVEIRNLEPKETIQKGVQSREEVRKYLTDRIREEYPKEEIEAEERLLERLGLIPEELPLYDFMLELLTEQVAGYYDPYSKTFYIADWIPLEIQKPVMAHELTHALQDQYFDLKNFLTPVEGNDDRTLARNALIEGEGFIIMLEYTLRDLGRSFDDVPDLIELSRSQMPLMEAQFPVFGKAPDYLKETLMFPYTYGGAFLKQVLTDGSWQDVTRIYTDLPQSTEQILHPEKYLDSRDHPTELEGIQSSELPGGQWSRIVDNVLGEFSIYLLLREYVEDEKAVRASKGWDGDRVELWENSTGKTVIILNTIWDTEADAAEFFAAFSEVMGEKYPGAEQSDHTAEASQVRTWRGSGIEAKVTRQGNRVSVSDFET